MSPGSGVRYKQAASAGPPEHQRDRESLASLFSEFHLSSLLPASPNLVEFTEQRVCRFKSPALERTFAAFRPLTNLLSLGNLPIQLRKSAQMSGYVSL